jgi:2-aminoethylphosphonate-pyruvate transaminase
MKLPTTCDKTAANGFGGLATAADPRLFTPGPLTTSRSVKAAMLRDVGSWDKEFAAVVAGVRESLLAVAGLSKQQGYEAILMQGSGTFAMEAVVASTLPPDGKLLVIANGAYGERLAKIAAMQRVALTVLRCPENQVPAAAEVDRLLSEDPAISNVAIVHCETTSGILNPIEQIGPIVKRHGGAFCVDAMSTFGAVPIDFAACGIDYLVSSANKCIEGVPGFAYVICRRDSLTATEGWARSLSLDLLGQWQYMERTGLFRFTPPTHVILAFAQALAELECEGGVAARAVRYRTNYQRLISGMRTLGFREYLRPDLQGYIITSFLCPEDPRFDFKEFYNRLHDQGYIIYSGKVSDADCFRIGSIGRIFESDMDALLAAIARTLREMQVCLPPPAP